MIRTRIAPTPSGYLHIGNAVNFLRTWLMVRSAHGLLKLRIDDADNARTRPEYVEDIFRQLDWLGIDWDEGPSSPDDFKKNYSQLLRVERYREVLGELRLRNLLFPCTCSRSQIRKSSGNGLYPGTCRSRSTSCKGETTVRILVPVPTEIMVNHSRVPLCQVMGDFVVWRRDDLPAYQLASLVDDLDDRINLVVRGEDLLPSSAAQLFLAEKLQAEGFLRTTMLHHELIAGHQGRKLSKSDNALSLKAMRKRGVSPTEVYRVAARQLGIDPAGIEFLDDLLEGYLGFRAVKEFHLLGLTTPPAGLGERQGNGGCRNRKSHYI
ncbi:MAG: glutamate--tRNA ligase family protein [Deltaproteobacteria bacterium]